MRLTTIQATDLFSFDDLSLTLKPPLTVIVGPNGAGKTNVVRALQLARLAVAFVADQSQAALQRLAVFAAARRATAAPGGRTSVTIGIEMDSADERRLIGDFVRAATVSGLARDAANRQVAAPVLQWIDEQVTDATLAPLLTGQLVVDLPRYADDRWEVMYRFALGEDAYVVDLTGGLGGIRLEHDGRRDGLQSASIGSRVGLRADAVDEAQSFSLVRALPEAGQLTEFFVDPHPAQPLPDALRRFYASVGADTRAGPPRQYGLASVLDPILRRGLAILSEVRLPPRTSFPAAAEPDDDRSWLPLRLFELKNGDAGARSRFEAVRAMYAELVGGPTFDLTAAHEPPEEQSGDSALRINLVVPGGTRDIPIEFGGMGAWEAVALSSVLADRSNRVVVLDEPAVNLHPVAQRRLLNRLLQAEAEQSIVVTHSPYLVPAGSRDQLAQIVRIDRTAEISRVHRLEPDVEGARSTWVKELADSADARAMLFAAGAILLEGDTELGALAVWFSRCDTAQRCGSPEQLNVSLVNVGGDRNFRTFIELCRNFSIPWAAICDGAALDSSRATTEQVLRQLVAAGAGDEDLSSWLRGASAVSFEEVRDQAAHRGIFTLALGAGKDEEGFEAFLREIDRAALEEAQHAEPDSKPRRGRWFAEQVECPRAVDELYAKVLRHLGLCERESSMSAGPASS
jgi:energy-coupling factor transporter ATP-binding protein EcfA2